MAITQINSDYGVASNEFDFDDASLDIIGTSFGASQGAGTVHIGTVSSLSANIINSITLTQGKSDTNGRIFTTASITPSPNKLIFVVCVARGDQSAGGGLPDVYGAELDFKTIGTASVETGISRVTAFRAQSSDPKTGPITLRFKQVQDNCQWGVFELENTTLDIPNDGAAAVIQVRTPQHQGPATAMGIAHTLAFADAANTSLGVFGFHDLVDTTPTVTVGTDYTELVEQTTNEAIPSSGGVYAEARFEEDTTPDADLNKAMDWGAVVAEIEAIQAVEVSTAITSWGDTQVTLDLDSLSVALKANLSEDLGSGQRFIIITTDTPTEFGSPVQTTHRVKAFGMALSGNITASGEDTTGQLTTPGSDFGDLVTSPPQTLSEEGETDAQLVFTNQAKKGNLLILLHHVSGGATQSPPTDGGTGQWFEVPSNASDDSGGEYRVYYKIAFGDEIYAEGHSASFTDHLLIVYEVVGPWNEALLDVHAANSGQTTTAFDTTVTGTTAVADSFAVVLVGGEPTINPTVQIGTWQNSYIEDIDPSSLTAATGDTHLGGAHRVLTATGTARGQATWSASHEDSCGIVVVFSGRDPLPSGIFGGGRIQDDENPGDAVDIADNEFREDEWCIEALVDSVSDETYQFRTLIDGVVPNIISAIPTLIVTEAIAENITASTSWSWAGQNLKANVIEEIAPTTSWAWTGQAFNAAVIEQIGFSTSWNWSGQEFGADVIEEIALSSSWSWAGQALNVNARIVENIVQSSSWDWTGLAVVDSTGFIETITPSTSWNWSGIAVFINVDELVTPSTSWAWSGQAVHENINILLALSSTWSWAGQNLTDTQHTLEQIAASTSWAWTGQNLNVNAAFVEAVTPSTTWGWTGIAFFEDLDELVAPSTSWDWTGLAFIEGAGVTEAITRSSSWAWTGLGFFVNRDELLIPGTFSWSGQEVNANVTESVLVTSTWSWAGQSLFENLDELIVPSTSWGWTGRDLNVNAGFIESILESTSWSWLGQDFNINARFIESIPESTSWAWAGQNFDESEGQDPENVLASTSWSWGGLPLGVTGDSIKGNIQRDIFDTIRVRQGFGILDIDRDYPENL